MPNAPTNWPQIKKKKPSLKQYLPLLILVVALPIVLFAASQIVQYMGKASGIPANIVVDTESIIGPMPHPWRNLAQGGEEQDPMLDDVIPAVKALSPEYIRIDHLYDAYKVVNKNGNQLTYDWSKLDQVVNNIIAMGAKPMLSLSYMPPAISSGDIIAKPSNWSDWEEVVKATVEHYSGRQNKNISGIMYEVWNEPDLFGGWKTYGDKNYLTLYMYSVRGANRAQGVNSFKIGGPATTALYKEWVDGFLNFVANNHLRLDFYSWHRYNTTLEQYESDASAIDTWLESHPEYSNLELTITEWGHNSEIDKGYDGMFGAIQTIAGSRVMMGRINRGFIFEIKDGPGNSQYWGRWGLLTHEKFGTPVKKPRYYAIQFLNRMGPDRVSLTGEGTWVRGFAGKSGNTIQTLLVNYDPSGKHSEAVPVMFDNLPSGNFTYKRTDFLGGSSSREVATTSAAWKTMELMKPNSATILELTFPQ